MEPGGVSSRTFCNKCQRETNHSVRHCLDNDRNDGTSQAPRPVHEEWRLLQCNGCDSIHVHVTEASPNDKSPRCACYPPRQFRCLPSWYPDLSGELQVLIREIYLALSAECPTLAVMGARTLVDKLLTESLGDIGGFQQKLNAAVDHGVFTRGVAENVAAAVEVGHAASHRGYAPTQQEVFDVLEIVEHCLQASYVLNDKSRRLIVSVPPRGARK